MTQAGSLLAFTLAATLLTIAPGVDTALVLRTAALEGSRRAAFTAAGICSGLLVWAIIVALGLGAVLAASRFVFETLRWAGFGYLMWLGLGMLLRPHADWTSAHLPASRAGGVGASYGRGLLSNLLNPKVGVFYVTFLPQFVPSGVDPSLWIALLAFVDVAESAAWLAVLIVAAGSIGPFLRKRTVACAIERITGALLLGFGLHLVTDARR